jgi:uncharacterized protein (DUF608 family)
MRCGTQYSGEHLSQISFPLGGIGTGCIGLAGNGRLVDWEIFNRPNKGSTHGYSHFAIKAESNGKVLDARVLQGDLNPPYSGALRAQAFGSFGFGPPRESMAGMPNFRDAVFTGEYPIARIDFAEPSFPGVVALEAWNPLIPLNADDSGIPAGFFQVTVRNPEAFPITYTVAGSLKNPHPRTEGINRFRKKSSISQVHLISESKDPGSVDYGDMCIATDARDTSYQEYWYRGSWFDNLSVYWQDFTAPGQFKNRQYPPSEARSGVAYGNEDLCTLAGHVTVEPGETATVRFVVSWSFPNLHNYWNPECCKEDTECTPTVWRNYYATKFGSSADSAGYALTEWDRLYAETDAFRRALFGSTVPTTVLDAVSANISILKSPTVLRLEDGTFYGFEGCHPGAGCCEGSCTHVWNYAYALPFLFPALERTMRDADFTYNMGEHGDMSFRLQLPLGRDRLRFRPCADGQFGGVMKMYREWKVSGDTEWLRHHWSSIKKSIAFAWSEHNPDRWDRDRDGVLEGRQHHTLDMELFGPNSWLTGFYLGALKAGAEMADALGEPETAKEYRGLFRRGKQWADANLFNGEYYHQLVDLKDRRVLETYQESDAGETYREGRSATSAYWSDEHGEIKYQVAEGCGIDQVLAQWHANLIGLGEIFDTGQTTKALESIYRYNFKRSMRDHVNPCRLYALNDEEAVTICEYPGNRPAIPVPYAEEAMNGFEYQVACHMIQEGMAEEGLSIVQAIRDRYDGRRRNPWNEFECGSNYARSMASYSLLLALSGFRFDLRHGYVGFYPVSHSDRFACFFCVEGGWGTVSILGNQVTLWVQQGEISISRFGCSAFASTTVRAVRAGEEDVPYAVTETVVELQTPVVVRPGTPITVLTAPRG